MSPEMLGQQGHTLTMDYYSLGAILYEMVTGLPPYYDKNKEAMYCKVLYEPLCFPMPISKELRNLLEGLLEKMPSNRIGSKRGIVEIKQHPWLKNIDYGAFLKKKQAPPFKVMLTAFNFDPEYSLPSIDLEAQSQVSKISNFSFHSFQSSFW